MNLGREQQVREGEYKARSMLKERRSKEGGGEIGPKGRINIRDKGKVKTFKERDPEVVKILLEVKIKACLEHQRKLLREYQQEWSKF